MRLFHLGLIAALVLGCGGGDSVGPSTGTLNVRFDAQTCGNGNATLFVDGANQGTFFWTAGVPREFTVQAGTHQVGAASAVFTWPAQSVSVPGGGTFNAIFTC